MNRGSALTAAALLVAAVALSSCANGVAVPGQYLVAQNLMNTSRAFLTSASNEVIAGNIREAQLDYRNAGRDCRPITGLASGPDRQINQLLAAFASDCASDADTQTRFWANPSAGSPAGNDAAVFADIRNVNARWRLLGY